MIMSQTEHCADFYRTAAVDEIQSTHPGIFGPNGGYSRAMSLATMGWTLGTFIGPILTGTLVEQVGYYEMTCVLGRPCYAFSGMGMG